VSDLPAFIAEASAKSLELVPGADIIAFGHVGDGNVHFNVSKPAEMDRDAFLARQPDVHRAVHDLVAGFNGSISAEHGIGVLKREELAARAQAVELDAMRAIKRALDPRNIMNPRVLFAPAET
jgi:FAD/FMN-containing dehydrogenase